MSKSNITVLGLADVGAALVHNTTVFIIVAVFSAVFSAVVSIVGAVWPQVSADRAKVLTALLRLMAVRRRKDPPPRP